MKDSSSNAVTGGMTFTSLSDCYKSVSDTWMNMYCNPARAYTNPFITTSNWSTASLIWSPQLETNSNELKINVKKRYIKFNFNL